MHLLLLSPKTRATTPAGLNHGGSAGFIGNGAESLAFCKTHFSSSHSMLVVPAAPSDLDSDVNTLVLEVSL